MNKNNASTRKRKVEAVSNGSYINIHIYVAK